MKRHSRRRPDYSPLLPLAGLKFKKPRREIEDTLQAAIVEYHGRAVDPLNAILYAVPNGEYRDSKTAFKLTGRKALPAGVKRPYDTLMIAGGQGVLPGVYDLVLLSPGATFTPIEAKRPKSVEIGENGPEKVQAGALSDEQKAFRDAAERFGFKPIVVHSILEYQAVLDGLGIPLRFRYPG